MSEWKRVKLGDYCLKIGSGSTPKGGSTVYVESGTSFIRSQNVYNLSFDYNGLTHITEEAANKLKGVTVFDEDILLNITGDSVARTCIVPNDVLPARVSQSEDAGIYVEFSSWKRRFKKCNDEADD